MKKSHAGEISLLLLWMGTLVYGWNRGGASAWFLFYGISALGLYCMCVHLFSLSKVEAVRQLSKLRFFEGEGVTVTVNLYQRSSFPLVWLVVRDQWIHSTSGQPYYYDKLLFPWLSRSSTFSYRIEANLRGKHKFRQLELITGDVFGFTNKLKAAVVESNEADGFVVYPEALQAPSLIGHPFVAEVTKIQHLAAKQAGEVSHVRDYENGDALNQIHWKLSSRSDELRTKEMTAKLADPFVIILNAAQTERHQHNHKAKLEAFEDCVRIAEDLLIGGRRKQLGAVGMVCNPVGGQVVRVSNRMKDVALLEFLALVECNGKYSASWFLQQEVRRMPGHTTLIYLTPTLDPMLIQTLPKLGLSQRSIRLHIWYVHPTANLSSTELMLKKQIERSSCGLHIIPLSDRTLLGKSGNGHG